MLKRIFKKLKLRKLLKENEHYLYQQFVQLQDIAENDEFVFTIRKNNKSLIMVAIS